MRKRMCKNKQNKFENYRKFTGINNSPSQDSIENIPLMHLQEKIDRFNCTASCHFIANDPVICHIKPANYLLESSFNSIERLIGENQSSDQSYCEKPLNGFLGRGLTLLEERRLEELNTAFTQERDASHLEECVQRSDILRLIERSVLRLIKMIKRYESYKCLCLPDQTVLMRAGCMEIIILRSILSYNFEQNSWNVS